MRAGKIVLGSLAAIALVASCASGSTNPGESTTGADTNAATSGGGGSAATSGGLDLPGQTTGTGTGGPNTGEGCGATSSKAELQPVYLGFAFDVSGSMGKLDKPYHDPKLKWEPVVAATRAFFEDPESKGILGSLTFFPIDESEDLRCDPLNYDVPDVAMTSLPSTAFGAAIDVITPKTSSEWRGGTPTLAAISGVIASMQLKAQAEPGAKYAIVLISDGYPNGCDDDTIASVNKAVAAVAATIPTFVIGVANPPPGPDTVTNLNEIAVAGGTSKALIIETGNPEKTKADFKAAIDGIRKTAISCNLEIPTPTEGTTFDPTKVNVTSTAGGAESIIGYDEACATGNAWHYDDPASPKSIVLCPGTCTTAQADLTTVLHVQLGCDTVKVPK